MGFMETTTNQGATDMTTLTPDTLTVFRMITEESLIWDDALALTPEFTKEQRGNFTDLIKKGLVEQENSEDGNYVWLTKAGRAFADANGIEYAAESNCRTFYL